MKIFVTFFFLVVSTSLFSQMQTLERLLYYQLPNIKNKPKGIVVTYYRYSGDNPVHDSFARKQEYFSLSSIGQVDTAIYYSDNSFQVNFFTYDPKTHFVKTLTMAGGRTLSTLGLIGIDTFQYNVEKSGITAVNRMASRSRHLNTRFILSGSDSSAITRIETLTKALRFEYNLDAYNRIREYKEVYGGQIQGFRRYKYNEKGDISEEEIADEGGVKFRVIKYEYTYDAKGNWITRDETWINYNPNDTPTARFKVIYLTREIRY